MSANVNRRIFDTVIGHKAEIKRLLQLLESGRMPNSLLLVGPPGQGKKSVALGFIQAMLCERSKTACGACPSCLSVANGQSLGLIALAPENGAIKIESARQVVEQLSLSTLGRARVVLIDEAEKLNPQAANALLKVIEEPPERTYFILTATSQEAVLKTVYSRSQVIRFKSLSRQELAEVAGQAVDNSELVELSWRIFENVFANDTATATQSARELIADREQALEVLQLWREFTRDIWLHKSMKSAELLHAAKKPAYENYRSQSDARLADFAELIQEAETSLRGNCDTQLTFENLILETRRAL